jgi:hypothetical protein
VHKRGTLKNCGTQNIIFIQQNWAEKINVLHYFLGAALLPSDRGSRACLAALLK